MKTFLFLLLFPIFATAAPREDVEREIQGAFERSEWTRQEKRAFALSAIAHSLDLYTSLKSEGCIEKNPILGEDPSDAALVGVKLFALGFEWWLYSSKRFDRQPTHWYGYTSAAIHGYIAYSNSQNRCFRG